MLTKSNDGKVRSKIKMLVQLGGIKRDILEGLTLEDNHAVVFYFLTDALSKQG